MVFECKSCALPLHQLFEAFLSTGSGLLGDALAAWESGPGTRQKGLLRPRPCRPAGKVPAGTLGHYRTLERNSKRPVLPARPRFPGVVVGDSPVRRRSAYGKGGGDFASGVRIQAEPPPEDSLAEPALGPLHPGRITCLLKEESCLPAGARSRVRGEGEPVVSGKWRPERLLLLSLAWTSKSIFVFPQNRDHKRRLK